MSSYARRIASCLAALSLMALTATTAARADEVPRTLADAAECADWSAVGGLLQGEPDVNAAQADGMTALHWAVYHDNFEIVGMLIDAGADAKAENRYGVPPLSIACQNGNGRIVSVLLAAGAEPNKPLLGGETPLMTAARTGKLAAVQALLDAGADVIAHERKGQTALMWAAAEGNVEVVDALLDAGAEFRTPLPSGFTPFFFAVREGHSAVVFRLLEAGIDINDVMQPQHRSGNGPKPETSPLLLAVENGHFELAAELLEAGADPNDDRVGFTPLHAMTWVRKPIRGDGDPPPIGSGSVSSLDMVRRLVAHGADVNARHSRKYAGGNRVNRDGATPFLLAAEASDVPLMQLLVELGADPRLANVDNSTPLLAAAGVGVLGNGDESAGTEAEAIAAVRLLLELGADINHVDEEGNTVMHGAAYQSRAELVHVLAEHEADINIWHRKNKRGWTPLMIAQGHRPGNFRPSPETIVAFEKVMRAAGVEPEPLPARQNAAN